MESGASHPGFGATRPASGPGGSGTASPPHPNTSPDEYASTFSRSMGYRVADGHQLKREVKDMKPKLDSAVKALDRTSQLVS
jgi:hypothetical protein